MAFSNVIPSSQPRTRRVFFSFHFQNDIWRVNQVRQSWRYNNPNSQLCRYSNDDLGFRDASIWERAKREGVLSMKRLIDARIKNTSVTCILAGSETYARRWVRYEIVKSVINGNALLVVYINELKDSNGFISQAGPNPLNLIGVYRGNSNGAIYFAERASENHNWQCYNDYSSSITLRKGWTNPTSANVIPLVQSASTYFYNSHNGKDNFARWVHLAANSLG